MDKQKDPLQELLSDDVKAADREQLAALLTPYISFERKSGEIHFKGMFLELNSNMDKLEIVFLAEKARVLLFKEGSNEGMSQGDIISFDIMPSGSVKSTLKKLSDAKKVRKNSSGKYYLPNYRIPELFDKYSIKKNA